MQDILVRIREQYDRLTKAEKLVADYVLAHPGEVVYLSINDLAKACGTGETSVFRFCRTLNQKGYQGFKLHVAQSIASNSEEAAAFQITGTVSFQDSLEEIVQKILSASIGVLQETVQLISPEDIRTAIQWMIGARRIQFFGVGGSIVTALDAYNRFLRIMPNIKVTMDLHFQFMEASHMEKEDLGIVFSYTGATKDTLNIAERIKEGGAKLIAITHARNCPLAGLSDLVLPYGGAEGPLQGGSMTVKVAHSMLLDVLYFEYFKQTREKSMQILTRCASGISDKIL